MEKQKEKNATIKYKISQIKLPIHHTTSDLKNKVIDQLKIHPNELVSLEILKKSIDARKKPNLFFTYSVVVELPKEHKGIVLDFTRNSKTQGISPTKSTPLGRSGVQIEPYQEIRYLDVFFDKINRNAKEHENKVLFIDDSMVKYSVDEPTDKVFFDDEFHSPIIVGTGPAGLFCGYLLALAGLKPILLERGADVDQRVVDVDEFWNTGILNLDSNVQFGEGGAGTFSDGKLNTLVKDKFGRNRFVLETLVEHGAPKEILFEQKPHVGTDILVSVVKNLRKSIENLGGKVEFNTKFVDILYSQPSIDSNNIYSNQSKSDSSFDNSTSFDGETNTLLSLVTINPTLSDPIPNIFHTNHLVLAIGHSARDTFEMLYNKKVEISSKPFAVGLRIEHPQELINKSQYGVGWDKGFARSGENANILHSDNASKPISSFGSLPAASYRLAENLENGRGVYSFCMCPGGVVVNASSEDKALTVNGMSYHARAGKNSNSAIVVTVSPDDFPSTHPLSGIEFQRNLEKKAYLLGNGKVPVQKVGDFLLGCNLSNTNNRCHTTNEKGNTPSGSTDKASTNNRIKLDCCDEMFNFTPSIKGQWKYADLTNLFPSEIKDSLGKGILRMSDKIANFAHPNALLSGVESRTSSPVKFYRDENFQSNIRGIYPCGEGAGYAGGITSAGMDGLKVAEIIINKNNVKDIK